MNIYYKYCGVKQGKYLYEIWKALDRSDLKRVLLPDQSENHIRAKAAELLGIRDGRLTEVRE